MMLGWKCQSPAHTKNKKNKNSLKRKKQDELNFYSILNRARTGKTPQLDQITLTSKVTIKNCLNKLLTQPPTPILVEKSAEDRLATWHPWDFKQRPSSSNVSKSSTNSIFSANRERDREREKPNQDCLPLNIRRNIQTMVSTNSSTKGV